MKYTLVLFLYIFSVYASCIKTRDCKTQTYYFATNIQAYPDADSLNINDTIWLDFTCPTRLTDLNTNTQIDYNGAKLSMSINFDELIGGSISNPGAIPAVDAFNFILINGTFIPDDLSPDRNKDYMVAEINNEYKFKLGIIPKRVGIFSVALTNATNVYRISDECTKASFSITFSNTNQHLYFYEQNRPGYSPSLYEREHMYCFKVK